MAILLSLVGLISLITVISSEEGVPELFVRKIVLEDAKTGTTKIINDLEKLDGHKYFHKVLENQYKLYAQVEGFVITCRAEYPVYWNFNQHEGGPYRDKDSRFILYTERNASVPSINATNPRTNNYLANIQVVIKRSEFTGNYSCHSVANPAIQKSIFLYVREKYDEANLVYNGQDIYITFHGEAQLNLPCLVNSPAVTPKDVEWTIKHQQVKQHDKRPQIQKDGILLMKLDKVDGNGTETWKILQRNGSITYDPTTGFQLKTKGLPALLGKYRCVSGINASKTDFVNITITEKALSEELHFADPEPKSEIGPGAGFEFRKWTTSFYENRDANDAICCSSDDSVPNIYESECYNPMDCLSRRKLIAANKLTLGRGGYSRGSFGNCTFKDFMYNAAVGYAFKCQGKGIYVMNEYVPSFVSDDKEEPWARFHTYDEATADNDMLSLKIKISDMDKIDMGSAIINGTAGKNQTTKLLVAKCYYIEYFISDGLFWKLTWQNGTIQWVKGLKDAEDNWSDSYRPAGSKPLPIELNLKLNITTINQLTSISCYGPKWNSSEWVSSVTSEFNLFDDFILQMTSVGVNGTVEPQGQILHP